MRSAAAGGNEALAAEAIRGVVWYPSSSWSSNGSPDMAARVSHTTINCFDAYEVSEWWKGILDYTDVPGDPNEPGDEECMIVDPRSGHRLLFLQVADLQDPVGRIHLDLAPMDLTRDEEIERVLGLGAREVADRRRPDGSGWMVLEDPVGNRFCIVRGEQERSIQRSDHTA